MKKPLNPVFSEKEAKALLMNCMVCGKPTEGFYGAHASDTNVPQGTCSASCERIQAAKPKYPGFEEEDYLRRQAEQMDQDC